MTRFRTTPVPTAARIGLLLGPGLLAFGVWAFVVSGLLDQDEEGLAAGGMFAFWGLVITIVSDRSRRHGATYLEIDTRRGNAKLVENGIDRVTVPVHELGALTIETVHGAYQLRAAGLPSSPLYRSSAVESVQHRRAQLERIVGGHVIRQILLNDAPNEGAFRDDPSIAFRARTAVPDRARLDEILAVLARDASLAPRVEELRAALART